MTLTDLCPHESSEKVGGRLSSIREKPNHLVEKWYLSSRRSNNDLCEPLATLEWTGGERPDTVSISQQLPA